MSTQVTRGPSARSWRARLTSRGAIIAWVTGLVIALGATAWAISWHQATSHLRVESVGAPQCQGAATHRRTLTAGVRADLMFVTPAMRCVYTVRVSNDGPFTVHLDRAVLPFLGRGGGGVVKALPPVVTKVSGTDDVDALVGLDRDLPPGASTEFDVPVGYRESGCNSGSLWIRRWPAVSFHVLGGSAEVSGDGIMAWRMLHGQGGGCLQQN